MRETAGGAPIKDGMILLGLRSAALDYYPSTWDIFGGHLEAGDTPEQALVREFQEELGIVPIDFTCIAVKEEPNPAAYGPGRHHVYVIRTWTGIPRNLSDEHQEIAWFELGDLDNLALASDAYPRLFGGYG
ncbi:MAG: NUDIX domain-containing protein [Pseudomonadota bacterium]